MQRQWVSIVSVLAAYVMLVVLVCPAIPTPLYLSNGKSTSVTSMIAVPAVAFALQVRFIPADLLPVPGESIAPRSADLLAITCTRLC